MSLSFLKLAALSIAFFAFACGPQQGGVSPSDESLSVNDSACDIAATGPDCDSDGLTDACEAITGTDPCNSDSNRNGVGDLYDFPPNTLPPQDEVALRNHEYQQLADSLGLGSSATSGKAPSGSTVVISLQQIAFGPLDRIVMNSFQSNLKGRPNCQSATNLYLKYQGTFDGRPAELELCAILDRPIPDQTTNANVNLNGAQIEKWTDGWAKNSKVATYFIAESLNDAKANQVFSTLEASARYNVCENASTSDSRCSAGPVYLYSKMNLALQTKYTIKFVNAVGSIDTKVETKYWSANWSRLPQLYQVPFSQGFLGLWNKSAQ